MKLYDAHNCCLHRSETADVGYCIVWCFSGGFVTYNSWKVTVRWNFTFFRTWGIESIKALVRANWMPTQMHQVMCQWYNYWFLAKVCYVGFHCLGLISWFSFTWLVGFFVCLFFYLALIYVVFWLMGVLWVLCFVWKDYILKSRTKAINTFCLKCFVFIVP